MRAILILFLCFACVIPIVGQKNKTKQTITPKPFVLGLIDEIQSQELNEKRTLNIYLPEGYAEQDTVSYPVIYLLDGSVNEDFIHVVGLVQFYSFEWIELLPKSIVVGIANVDRRRDFTFPTSLEHDKLNNPSSGHSDKFISFMEKELQPFIEKNYRTNTTKTLIGQSLGGLLATEILLKHPALFDNYIIVSPSIWWNNGSILETESQLYTASFNQPTKVYIAVGKEGLTPTEVPRVMEVDANLLADKLKNGESEHVAVYFDYLPNENHGTILHQAVSNSFKILYGNTKRN